MTTHRKDIKIHRKNADYLLRRTTNLIKLYNENSLNPLFVKRMVVFGSYANTDKEMLSDLDLALSWGIRTDSWNSWVDTKMDEMCRFYRRSTSEPDLAQIYDYMKRRALIYFRQRSAYIQFTTLDLPEE